MDNQNQINEKKRQIEQLQKEIIKLELERTSNIKIGEWYENNGVIFKVKMINQSYIEGVSFGDCCDGITINDEDYYSHDSFINMFNKIEKDRAKELMNSYIDRVKDVFDREINK